MTMPKKYHYVLLFEIDENIIRKVREIDELSDNYVILKNTIIEDGQRYPIVLRKLTEEEKSRAKPKAIYGIIDGHHRYHIASKSNKEEILADVLPDNEELGNALSDIKLALRLNESSIKMTNEEKGKLIYEMMLETGKNAQTVALELFGVKISMAYRCLNAYKKSIGAKVVSKPRKIPDFKIKTLKAAWSKISKVKNIPQNVDECISCLDDIANFEIELRKYKQILLAQDGVKDELHKRKSAEQK